MKKILLLIALLGSLFASAQIPGYTFTNAKYERLDEIFRALGLPGGDSAQFRVSQAQRQGAIYWDSTDNNTPKGLYIYDGTAWILQGQSGSISQIDAILFGGSVTPEGGFRFSVQEAIARIDNILYTTDSGTVIVDSADATYDRFDVIYIDATGVHVLEGIPAENPAIPQLQGGQLLLTVVSIEAGAIGANISTINIYFENDATITPSGTTAVGNSTAAPYAGTYHIRITTINNGDYIDIIKTSGTWDIAGQDFMAIHIKNLAQVPQLANLRASLWNGASTGSQVSGEIILNYNKNNSTTYQAISIPMSAFGNITNTNIDRIRLRFTRNNATTFSGYDIDNVFFGDNLQQPGTGNFSATLNMPTAFTVSPTNTIQNNGIWNVTANGTTLQYIDGTGALRTFSAVTTVGAFGSQASQANGAFISGSTIYFQPVTATEPGMPTPAMKASWDSVYTVENMSSLGESIMVNIDAARTGFKGFVGSASVTITPTDSTLVFTSSGGGGGERFGVEDNLQAEQRIFVTTGTDPFRIRGEGPIIFESENTGVDSVYISLYNQVVELSSVDNSGVTYGKLIVNLDAISFDQWESDYRFNNLIDSIVGTNYMMVWNSVTDQVHKAPLPTAGGGGSPFLPVTGTGTATGNVLGVLGTNKLNLTGSAGSAVSMTTDSITFMATVGIGIAPASTNDYLTVHDGVNRLLHVTSDGLSSFKSTDGTGHATLELDGVSAAQKFDIFAEDGLGNETGIEGNAEDAVINYIATNSHYFSIGNVGIGVDPTTALFQVQSGGNDFLIIDPTVNNENVFLQAYNITGSDNFARFSGETADVGAVAHMRVSFNGTDEAKIEGTASSGSAIIMYQAEQGHTFQGSIFTDADNTYDIGSAAASFKDGYLRRLLLDGSTSGTPIIESDALGDVLLGTVLSGQGTIPVDYDIVTRADETLANSTSDQPVFTNTAHDVIAVVANMTYDFEVRLDFTHGAVSHNIEFGMIPTTATITSIEYNALGWVTAVGTNTASQNTLRSKSTATTQVIAAGANGTETLDIKGTFTVGATGGSIMPTIQFSADPTGTILLKTGARFKLTARGNDTFTQKGPIN